MIEAGFFDLDKTTVDERGRAYKGLSEAFGLRPNFTRTILTARGFPRFREAIADNPSLAVTAGMPTALENGARIVDSKMLDNLYYHPLSADEQTAICDFIEKLAGLRYVAFHSQKVRTKTLLWSPDGDEAGRLHDAYSHNADVFSGSRSELYQTVRRHNPCMITCRTYDDKPQGVPGVTFYSRGTTINFIPKGPNKGTAAQIIADMRGIDLSKAMAAGNDHNDEPVLKLRNLGCPVVVGNDMAKDIKARLPEHTIYIPDPRKLGDFILSEVSQ